MNILYICVFKSDHFINILIVTIHRDLFYILYFYIK